MTRGTRAVVEPEVTLAAREVLGSPGRTAADIASVEVHKADSGAVASASGDGAPFALTGLFLLPNGQPAAGATAALQGWEGSAQQTAEFGRPDGWVNPSAVLGDDGRLRLEFDPPRACQFALHVELPGHASVGWRWTSLGPVGSKDLGTTTLGVSGDVTARIIDGAGEPLVLGWLVYSEGPPGTSLDRMAHGASAPIDRVTGRALLRDLPVGPNSLSAYHRSNGWLKGPTVEVIGGETVDATLVWTGPDLSRRVRAGVTNRLFHTLADVEPGALVLVAGNGTETPFERGVVDDVALGVYSIQLDDERYDPCARRERHRLGTSAGHSSRNLR